MIDTYLLGAIAVSSVIAATAQVAAFYFVHPKSPAAHSPVPVPIDAPQPAALAGSNAPHGRYEMLLGRQSTGHWVSPGSADYNEILLTPGLSLRDSDGNIVKEQ